MLTKLSRIFGITGGVLAMLPYVFFIGGCVSDLMNPDMLYNFSREVAILTLSTPALLCSAALIAAIYVRKNPIFAGTVMIVSFVLNAFSPDSGFISYQVTTAVRQLSALLLVSGGVLAIISRFTRNKASRSSEPQSGKQMQATVEKCNPLLILSRAIAAVVCAALIMYFWVCFSIYTLSDMPYTIFLLPGLSTSLIISAFGLWGSLLLIKKPVIGAVLMFVSGGLIFLFSLVFQLFEVTDLRLGIIPLLLAAAGVFALICGAKSSSRKARPNENPDHAG